MAKEEISDPEADLIYQLKVFVNECGQDEYGVPFYRDDPAELLKALRNWLSQELDRREAEKGKTKMIERRFGVPREEMVQDLQARRQHACNTSDVESIEKLLEQVLKDPPETTYTVEKFAAPEQREV